MSVLATVELTPEELLTVLQWAKADFALDGRGSHEVQSIGAKAQAAGAAFLPAAERVIAARKAEAAAGEQCLTPNCRRPVRTAGCCGPCHSRHLRDVRKGRTTRAQLEAAGRLRPDSRRQQ